MCIQTDARQLLISTGAPDELLKAYDRFVSMGNEQGQARVLMRWMRMQNAALSQKREQLNCLDYLITQLEETT